MADVKDSNAGRVRGCNPLAEVLQWIGAHPASPGTFNSAASTASEWTNRGSADEVTAWLQANPENPAYDGAAAGFAVQAFKFDPEVLPRRLLRRKQTVERFSPVSAEAPSVHPR